MNSLVPKLVIICSHFCRKCVVGLTRATQRAIGDGLRFYSEEDPETLLLIF